MQNQAKVIVLRSRFETIKFHVFGVDFHDSMFTTLSLSWSSTQESLRRFVARYFDVFRFRLDFFPRSGDAKRGHLLRPLLSSQNLLHRSKCLSIMLLVIRTLVINIGHEYFRIDSLNFHKITSKINRPRPD